MCGIAGVIDLVARREIGPARLGAMTAAIAARGPDGEGRLLRPGLALGHRRLAIIDLETGAQPMQDAAEEIAVVFNGEIYNFKALRAELEARGHVFRTRSDTETLLHGWREWGAALPEKLDGFFAAVIWDARSESLIAIRDLWGKKPFYWRMEDGFFVFGSDPRAVAAGLNRRPDLREDALADYLSYGYVPDTKCIYAGIEKLQPASMLIARRGRPLPQPTRWRDFALAPHDDGMTLEEAAEALRPLLRRAVEKRLIADAPLGAFLSGGVDSAAMLAMMGPGVPAITVAFDDPAFDESALAAQTAQHCGAQHVIERMDALAAADLDAFSDAYPEPFADASALPTLILCKAAARHVKVAISGDGGDELFAGYRRYPFHLREERAKALLPAVLRASLLGPLSRAWPEGHALPRPLRAKATLESLAADQMGGLHRATAITPPAQLAALLSPGAARRLGGYDPADILRGAAARAQTDDPLAIAQSVDLATWLPGRMLVKVDRASMAMGLEARNPLLDRDVAAFAATLPTRLKLDGFSGKRTLKAALSGLAPQAVLTGAKRGFTPPIAEWMRGPWRARMEGLAFSPRLCGLDLINPQTAAGLWRETRAGHADHSRTLFALLALDLFLEREAGAFRAAA